MDGLVLLHVAALTQEAELSECSTGGTGNSVKKSSAGNELSPTKIESDSQAMFKCAEIFVDAAQKLTLSKVASVRNTFLNVQVLWGIEKSHTKRSDKASNLNARAKKFYAIVADVAEATGLDNIRRNQLIKSLHQSLYPRIYQSSSPTFEKVIGHDTANGMTSPYLDSNPELIGEVQRMTNDFNRETRLVGAACAAYLDLMSWLLKREARERNVKDSERKVKLTNVEDGFKAMTQHVNDVYIYRAVKFFEQSSKLPPPLNLGEPILSPTIQNSGKTYKSKKRSVEALRGDVSMDSSDEYGRRDSRHGSQSPSTVDERDWKWDDANTSGSESREEVSRDRPMHDDDDLMDEDDDDNDSDMEDDETTSNNGGGGGSGVATKTKKTKLEQENPRGAALLQMWFQEHIDHPYPTLSEKKQLSQESHMTLVQVQNWFTNHRARNWKKQPRSSDGGGREKKAPTRPPRPSNGQRVKTEKEVKSEPKAKRAKTAKTAQPSTSQFSPAIPPHMAGNPALKVEDGQSPKLGVNATTKLRSWFYAHIDHPYPTSNEKMALARQTGMTLLQIQNWFSNERMRKWERNRYVLGLKQGKAASGHGNIHDIYEEDDEEEMDEEYEQHRQKLAAAKKAKKMEEMLEDEEDAEEEERDNDDLSE
eukprot:GFYU01000897.1.p1 GENE.GFYU01000897.1~~GFYU01000897.1.p1  ORF type:complete len:661 (+),score=204.60 GFYU01000897.1:42-1985(+)